MATHIDSVFSVFFMVLYMNFTQKLINLFHIQ